MSEAKMNLEKAVDCIRTRFGSTWQSPYSEGKETIAFELSHSLGLPHTKAVEVVDQLEQKGQLSYTSAAVESPSTSPQSPAGSTSSLPPMGEWHLS